MKIFILSFVSLVLYSSATFSQTHKELSLSNICGTYYMVRRESALTEATNQKEERWFDDFRYFVISEKYYILGIFEERSPYYRLAKKDSEGMVEDGDFRPYTCSEFCGYFSEYLRSFDTVILTSGYIPAIEVIDFDTVIILFNSSYILYKRAK